MPPNLSANEARVIGCLIEKSIVTPDQYPLTLNALTNACNQKSSRDPVMSLEPGEVMHTVRALQDKHLIRVEENFRTQIEKFTQRLCNTPFSDYQFERDNFYSATYAVRDGRMFENEGWEHAPGSNVITWVKHYLNSPIAYLQCGDDSVAYENEHFRTLLANAIQWAGSNEARAWARDRNEGD